MLQRATSDSYSGFVICVFVTHSRNYRILFNPGYICLLTKLSKNVYHDKSYLFETDFGWFIRFNEKKNTCETKCPFLYSLVWYGILDIFNWAESTAGFHYVKIHFIWKHGILSTEIPILFIAFISLLLLLLLLLLSLSHSTNKCLIKSRRIQHRNFKVSVNRPQTNNFRRCLTSRACFYLKTRHPCQPKLLFYLLIYFIAFICCYFYYYFKPQHKQILD